MNTITTHFIAFAIGGLLFSLGAWIHATIRLKRTIKIWKHAAYYSGTDSYIQPYLDRLEKLRWMKKEGILTDHSIKSCDDLIDHYENIISIYKKNIDDNTGE